MNWDLLLDADTATLPSHCFVAIPGLPAGANVFLCVRGEAGVRPSRLNLGEYAAAIAQVRAINETLGVPRGIEWTLLAECFLVAPESWAAGGDRVSVRGGIGSTRYMH